MWETAMPQKQKHQSNEKNYYVFGQQKIDVYAHLPFDTATRPAAVQASSWPLPSQVLLPLRCSRRPSMADGLVPGQWKGKAWKSLREKHIWLYPSCQKGIDPHAPFAWETAPWYSWMVFQPRHGPMRKDDVRVQRHVYGNTSTSSHVVISVHLASSKNYQAQTSLHRILP